MTINTVEATGKDPSTPDRLKRGRLYRRRPAGNYPETFWIYFVPAYGNAGEGVLVSLAEGWNYGTLNTCHIIPRDITLVEEGDVVSIKASAGVYD